MELDLSGSDLAKTIWEESQNLAANHNSVVHLTYLALWSLSLSQNNG